MNGLRIIKNFLWQFMEKSGLQIVNLCVQIVLARILVPEDFAAVAIIMVFINLANTFVQSGFGTALIQNKDTSEDDYSSVFFTSLTIAVVLILLLYFIAPVIAGFYNIDELIGLIRGQSLILIFGAFNTVQLAILSRNLQFKKNFIARIIACVMSGIIGVVCAYIGFGVWSIVILNVTNNIVYTVILWMLVKWRPRFVYSIERVKELFSFSWKLVVASMIGILCDNFRTLVIGKAYQKDLLGYYNRADTVAASLMSGITASISSVMLPVLSKKQDDSNEIKTMLRKTFQLNCFICVPMMLGLSAIGTNFIIALFSKKWIESGLLLSIICIGYSFYPMHSANLQAIYSVGRSDIALKLEVIKRSLSIILIIACIPLGIYAMTISVVISSMLSTVINSYPNKKLLKYNIVDQIKDVAIYYMMSFVMMIIVVVVGRCLNGINIYLLLAIQIIAGISVYIIESIIIKPYAFQYCCSLLKNIINRKRGKPCNSEI